VKLLNDIISSSRTPEDVLAAKVTLADLYMTRNNSAAAEPLIKEILVADSRNIDGLRLRAAIRFDRGQYDEATEDLRQALNDQPKSAQLLASLGVVYERSGKIELASDAYLEAMKASAYDPRYGLKYITFLRRRGLNTQAGNVLSELASHNPNSRAVLSALAKEKLNQKDWAGAHTIANQIRKLGEKADTVLADQIQGAAFGGEEKYSDSLAALQNVYDAVPQAVQPMVSMVTTFMRAKQPEKAEEFLQAALKTNPDNAEALVLMGTLRLVGKKPEEAATYFKSAIEKKPKSAVGYRALADLYARQGKLDEAVKTVRAGIKEQPNSFGLGLMLAGILEAKQEYEPAIAEYENMLKVQPGSLVVMNNLASLLADHRSDKASLERAESLAVSLKKVDVPQFMDTLGWVAYRRGDYPAAVKLLEEAEAKLSKVPLISYHLGAAYLAVNENQKAMDQFKKAREMAPNDAKLKALIDAAIKGHQDKKPGKQPEANGSGPG
jgi:Tfp pilus assembly protein PilF